jgi:hypothetical protein
MRINGNIKVGTRGLYEFLKTYEIGLVALTDQIKHQRRIRCLEDSVETLAEGSRA